VVLVSLTAVVLLLLLSRLLLVAGRRILDRCCAEAAQATASEL
jgi:hypothetical protein